MRCPNGHIFECKNCKIEVDSDHFITCFDLTPDEAEDFKNYIKKCDQALAEGNQLVLKRLRATRATRQSIIQLPGRERRLRWKADFEAVVEGMKKKAAEQPSTIH